MLWIVEQQAAGVCLARRRLLSSLRRSMKFWHRLEKSCAHYGLTLHQGEGARAIREAHYRGRQTRRARELPLWHLRRNIRRFLVLPLLPPGSSPPLGLVIERERLRLGWAAPLGRDGGLCDFTYRLRRSANGRCRRSAPTRNSLPHSSASARTRSSGPTTSA
jgi:hypothetical protein